MSVRKPEETGPDKPVARRRRPADVRQEALRVGRMLLMSEGPKAITLKAVGAGLGMSHANVLHHFGTAQAFQSALMDAMVTDLVDHVSDIVVRADRSEIGLATIVDEVFTAYAAGGIGKLVAWLHLNGEAMVSEPLTEAIGRLVATIRSQGGGTTDPGLQVSVLSMMAFAASVLEPTLDQLVGTDPGSARAVAVRVMTMLGSDPGAATAPPLSVGIRRRML